jgi:uroporphyrinogen-III synthase
MSVQKILISQQQPMTASPYTSIAEKFGVEFDFKPFFKIEPLTSREFRTQRINILDHTAVVFSARTTIDAFFQICEELRVKVPETMKYFCTTEAVANYLQKHIVYRKRKIFFGDGKPESIIGLIGSKHKGEKFLIATVESTTKDAVTKLFEKENYDFETAVFVKPVPQDLKEVDLHSYKLLVFFNPADVKSLYENQPEFQQNGIKFISYGKSVVNAMQEAGLDIEISAPTAEIPSVAKALELYLSKNN